MPSTASLRARLDDGLGRLGGTAAMLDNATRERLIAYVLLLGKWNRIHNLTAVRTLDEMIGRHVLDSLVLLPFLSECPARQDGDGSAPHDLLDIGSGAGLPVLPLAIACRDLYCLSVESNNKKVAFQRQAVLELGLVGVEVRHARIETVQARARQVVSRAFAAPVDFLSLAAPLCASRAAVIVMLGRADALPDALPEPFVLESLGSVDVPFSEGERHVAICRFGGTPEPRP